ncbi:hypothetical protein OKW26_000727 [Paraburkholderia sp. 32]
MFAELRFVVRVKARRTSRTIALSDRLLFRFEAAGTDWLCIDASFGISRVCAFAQVAQVAMATANIAPRILLAPFVFILPPLPVCQELPFEPRAASGEEAVQRTTASRRVIDRRPRLYSAAHASILIGEKIREPPR